jgi:hypothetical protein
MLNCGIEKDNSHCFDLPTSFHKKRKDDRNIEDLRVPEHS